MDIEQMLAAVRRHWRAVVVVVLLTAVAVVQVPKQIKPEFVVSGNMILVSPATVPSGTGDVDVNPWSRFGGAESGAAAALVAVLQSDETGARVLEDKLVKSFEVGINARNGAIIELTVEALTEQSALDAYELALQLLTSELENRQQASGAPRPTWMHADVLTKPDRPKELPGSKTRVMLAVGVIGLAAAVSLAVALDMVVTSRRNQRTRPTSIRDADQLDDSFRWEPVFGETGTAQRKRDRRTTEHRGTEHRGTEHRGTEHRGTEHRGTEHRGTEHRGTEQRGTEQRGTEHRGEVKLLKRGRGS